MLKSVLHRVVQGESLDANDMAHAVGSIMDGEASEAEIAALLVALHMKGETSDEIFGAARAMRERMHGITIERRPLLDTCGTGGDGASTFNISTAAAFVLAAGGVAVAKHGNRAISSRSGSADVLAELGFDLQAPAQRVQASVENLGIGFLFAPNCNPAMQHAAPVRKMLGIRTIFNAVGPLTNPALATHQVLGVYAEKLLEPMAAALGRLGLERAWVVHGRDGLDELTLCAPTQVAEWTGNTVRMFSVAPEEAGLSRCHPSELSGGDAVENARLLSAVLRGRLPGPKQDAVALNAGAGFLVGGTAKTLREGVERATELLAAGEPMQVLQSAADFSRRGRLS